MATRRLREEITLRGRPDRGVLEASITPNIVSLLNASAGDVLVVEQGSMAAAEKAAVPGPYLVVTIRRTPSPAAPVPPTAAEQEPEREAVTEPAAPGESLADLVRKKIDERQR